jgi:hypothetical protein
VLLNPMRFRDVTRAVLGSVRADEGFGTDELLDLGRAMRDFSPSSSEFTTVPIGQMNYAVKGIGSTLKWDQAKAGRLFAALRDDKPLTAPPPAHPPQGRAQPPAPVEVDPRQIQVQVANGTATMGLAKRVDAALAAAGFATTRQPVTAPAHVPHTVISYDPRWDRSARALATALPGAQLRAVPGQGPLLKVTAGADFKDVRKVRFEDPAQPQQAAVRGNEVTCAGA